MPADWRDFLALTKPRVMTLVVFTGLCGLLAAPVHIHPVIAFTAILCIAPAPSAMQRIAVKAMTGWMCTGAARRPHRPVNTTNVITRGLVSARKSRQSAGKAGDNGTAGEDIGRAYRPRAGFAKAFPATRATGRIETRKTVAFTRGRAR